VRGDADEAAVRRALAGPGTVMRAASVTEALARAERAIAKASQRGLSLAAGIGAGASLEDAGAQAVAALARVERGIALDEVTRCLASPRRGGEEPELD
jgi:GTP cyclohydrolase III